MPEPQWRRMEPPPGEGDPPDLSGPTKGLWMIPYNDGRDICPRSAPAEMPTARPVCVEGEWGWQVEEKK